MSSVRGVTMFGANSVDAIHVPFAATVTSVAGKRLVILPAVPDRKSVVLPAVEASLLSRARCCVPGGKHRIL